MKEISFGMSWRKIKANRTLLQHRGERDLNACKQANGRCYQVTMDIWCRITSQRTSRVDILDRERVGGMRGKGAGIRRQEEIDREREREGRA